MSSFTANHHFTQPHLQLVSLIIQEEIKWPEGMSDELTSFLKAPGSILTLSTFSSRKTYKVGNLNERSGNDSKAGLVESPVIRDHVKILEKVRSAPDGALGGTATTEG